MFLIRKEIKQKKLIFLAIKYGQGAQRIKTNVRDQI
jgi:hypothetical protein